FPAPGLLVDSRTSCSSRYIYPATRRYATARSRHPSRRLRRPSSRSSVTFVALTSACGISMSSPDTYDLPEPDATPTRGHGQSR
ncbi:hypothetical protein BD311DRAFT_762341, partial [Dichomitus squalens]